MAQSLTSKHVGRLLEDLQAHPTHTALNFKAPSKVKAGETAFHNVSALCDGQKVEPLYVQFNDVIITSAIGDPTDMSTERAKSLAKYPAMRLRLTSTVQKAGLFGQWIDQADVCFDNYADSIHAVNPLAGGGKKRSILHRSYVKDGKEVFIAEPEFQFDLQLVELSGMNYGQVSVFSQKHFIAPLRGTPKCTLLEWTLGPDGKEVLSEPKVEVNGVMVPVDFKNIHLWITPGSVIKRGRTFVDFCESASALSCPLRLHWAAIEINRKKGVIEDDYVPPASLASQLGVAPPTAAAANADPVAADASVPVEPADEQVPTVTVDITVGDHQAPGADDNIQFTE